MHSERVFIQHYMRNVYKEARLFFLAVSTFYLIAKFINTLHGHFSISSIVPFPAPFFSKLQLQKPPTSQHLRSIQT